MNTPMLRNRPMLVCLLLMLGACGGGGGSSAGDGNDPDSRHRVTVEVSGGGQVDPLEQTVAEGEQASIELLADQGFRVGSASGCGGSLSGEEYVTGPITDDCQVSVTFVGAGGVAGTLLPPPDTSVDATLNDRRAPLGENTACASAQEIESRTTLHGFASAGPTGGDPEEEHFAEASNPSDFYRVQLGVGQGMQLDEADYREGERDWALYLWNADCSRQVDTSDSGELEEVSSLLGGEHVVEVRAQAGFGKYVLRGASSWDTASSGDDLAQLSDDLPAFYPYEVIVAFEPDAGDQPHAALNAALDQAFGLQLEFRHEDPGRASLAKIQGLPALNLELPLALEELRLLDPDAFDRLNSLRLIDLIARQPGVRYAEPNLAADTQRQPDDPRFDEQWHYQQIDLPEAWDTTVGESAEGGDVVVAVLDTGVYLAHEDLQAKVLADGYDFHDGDADPDETSDVNSWHGTHVAGTVGAATNNGIGVAGTSWATRLLPVRVLGEEGGSRYDIIQGVRYAAGLPNDSGGTPSQTARVINLSVGGGGHSRTEQELYHEVRQRGVSIVAAAGNENSDEPMYPAAYDGVLSVSATTCREERAGYSNFGPTISLAAPAGDGSNCGFLSGGAAVLSTTGSGSGDSRSSDYGLLIGTSMATPHVSGVLALMVAVYPDLTPMDIDSLLADGQLTDDLGDEGRDDDFGHGQINARKAVEAARALAEGAQQPARVVADPATVFMGQESEAPLELRQEGEGQAPAVIDRRSGADWLSAIEQEVDDRGLGQYQVQVDRSQFSEEETGNFQSELIFTLDDESELSVAVHIQVGTAANTAPIYVVLLDPDSGEPVHEVRASRTSEGELGYRFEDVEPGEYQLLAGSDIDADDFICQPGEMCGAYPDHDNRETLTVADEMLEERDFVIDILTRFRPLAGSEPEPVARQ